MVRAARRGWTVWIVLVPVLLWALVRTFGLEAGFPAVPLMAFTPYVALVSVPVLGVALGCRNWPAAIVAAPAALCLTGAVLPRALGAAEPEPPAARRLDVLSANVHQGTADAAALVDLVRRRRPDLLSVQELTPSFARRLRRAGIDRLLPHTLLEASTGASGSGLYSRLPLRPLPQGVPYPFRMPRAELRLPGGRAVRVVDVHPYTPMRGQLDRWRAGLESLPSTGAGVPWALVGDFNATLDHAELRAVIDRGYRDAADTVGDGLEMTWPADWGLPALIEIDHVLADRRLAIAGYAVEDLPGTDHRPIFARLGVP